MDAKYDYLDGKPEIFEKCCDVLLKLDDGSKLPVHSPILAQYSTVVADMLDDGPLSTTSAKQRAELPLTDCTRDTANRFLTVLYSHEAVKHITKDTSMDIASLAHKLNMKVHQIRTDTS